MGLFSGLNVRELWRTVQKHDYYINELRKQMTTSQDALAALETEFNDATNAIATELDKLHAEIAAGTQGAVDRLKPLADRLRDMGTPATPITNSPVDSSTTSTNTQ